MAITVTLVGALDRSVEEGLRALGMRATTIAPSQLPVLAHPSSTPPDVVVLDLRMQQHIPPAVSLIKRQHPDTGLIIVATALDPNLMLEAMRAGVTECLTQVDQGELEAAITRLVAQRASAVEGEVFGVVGAKGGVGATTVAVNLATVLAKLGSTLVIDLHLAGGDATLYMGASSSFSIVDVLENIHRLDVTYFRGLVSHTAAGPDLLASADRAAALPVDPLRVRSLIDFAAHHYRFTVLDIPRFDMAMLDSLETVSTIIVVGNQELASVRSAGRLATMLRQQYGKEKVVVAMSRPDRQSEIGIDDVQGAVGGPVKYVFLNDYRLAVSALNRGRPLVLDGKTPLGAVFQTCARDLSGEKDKEKEKAKEPGKAVESSAGKGFLGRLAGRRT